MSLNCPATKAMLIMPKILMSCCGSTRYPDWCLDDRISSPHQYQTITPTQVLSETLGKASWGKICENCDRWWTHLLSIKRLCNKIFSCSQKKQPFEELCFWQVILFYNDYKDLLLLMKHFYKETFFLLIFHVNRKICIST